MYQIKRIPEDFVVTEMSDIHIKNKGRYLYFRLKKRNRNSLDVIKEIAKQLGIKERMVGFAGNKDKNAVTQQICSVYNVNKSQLMKVNIDQAELEFLGYGNDPISLGDHEGNHFDITVRNLTEVRITPLKYIPNYFDEQRFSMHNAEIGRHLIKKEFQAAMKFITNPCCKQYLEKNPNNFIGALKTLPLRMLKMYVNAYQSYLWNETLANYLRKTGVVAKEVAYSAGKFVLVKEPFPELKIPLLGFGNDEIYDPQLKTIIDDLRSKENLNHTDFIIKSIPELTLEGELRSAFVEVKDFKCGKIGPDELNPDTNKVTVSFSLGKGSYATMVIKSILDN